MFLFSHYFIIDYSIFCKVLNITGQVFLKGLVAPNIRLCLKYSNNITHIPVIMTTQMRVVHLDKHFTFYPAYRLSASTQTVAILSLVHTSSVVCSFSVQY